MQVVRDVLRLVLPARGLVVNAEDVLAILGDDGEGARRVVKRTEDDVLHEHPLLRELEGDGPRAVLEHGAGGHWPGFRSAGSPGVRTRGPSSSGNVTLPILSTSLSHIAVKVFSYCSRSRRGTSSPG